MKGKTKQRRPDQISDKSDKHAACPLNCWVFVLETCSLSLEPQPTENEDEKQDERKCGGGGEEAP